MTLPRRSLFALGAGAALIAAGQAEAAAPFRGGQVAAWYRLRLGGFECTVISDGAINLTPPHPTFGGNVATAAEVEALLRGAFLATDTLPTQLNCIVVNTGREVVLLDAGLGPRPAFGPGSGRLPTALAAAGIDPATVDLVAFTHAHADHSWGIADARGADVFPNARFAMTGADLAFWTDEANLALPEPLRTLVSGTRDVVLPRRARFATLGMDAELVPGIRSVASPGHTGGHVCFHLESQGQRLLVLGDVANHSVLALRRPDWPFAFDADPAAAAATRRRILGLAATDRVQVLGYHFPWPGLGHVEAAGDGFAYVPSPWNWG
jgi:glyoxylase-like metal-dependent hydrolase (beta-lactamase superfamily II)